MRNLKNKQYVRKTLVLGVLLFYWLLFLQVYGQSVASETKDSTTVDEKYREDQFYFGLTFNFLTNLPKEASQTGFSGGFHLGFIRDFPLNENRNIALGAGLGWSINTYRSNLLISKEEDGSPIFQVLDDAVYDYKVNRFSTQLIEVPLEFRWRTSSAEEYSFWRIYTGLRIGYMYYFQSYFKQPGKHIRMTQLDALQRWRYGLTLTFGYNTFNFTVYYSLNSFFDSKDSTGTSMDMSTLKIGLMFYIL